jgi:hypothetical protein
VIGKEDSKTLASLAANQASKLLMPGDILQSWRLIMQVISKCLILQMDKKDT